MGWSREKLAEKAGVAAETVKRTEFRGSNPKLEVASGAEAAGVEFIDNDAKSFDLGVRLRAAKGKR